MNDTPTRPLQVGYLVVGLVFLGIAGAWALRASDVVDTSQVQWLIPVVLVGAGVIGLVAFAARGRGRAHRNDTSYDEPVDDPDELLPGQPWDADTEPTTRIQGDDR